MFDVFLIMRQLHEMLWYLTQALMLPSVHAIEQELNLILYKTENFTRLSPDYILKIDVAAHTTHVGALLLKISELVRTNDSNKQNTKLDYIWADLRDADIRHANLSNSIFLTQSQVNTAKGDSNTKLPKSLTRPIHW